MRRAKISRSTTETSIEVEINLDGTGAYDVKTGVGFFDHMVEQLARHSIIDITLRAVMMSGKLQGRARLPVFIQWIHQNMPAPVVQRRLHGLGDLGYVGLGLGHWHSHHESGVPQRRHAPVRSAS